MVDLCKTAGLIIVNECIGSHRNIDEHTCPNYNSRTVMNFMVENHLFLDQFSELKFESFDLGLSDVHCAFHCEFELSRCPSSNNANDVKHNTS